MSFKSWDEIKLGDLFIANYGKSLPKKARVEGKYKVYGSGGITGTHKEKLVNGPGIIIGRKGTVGALYFEEEDYYPIDTVYYIEPSFKYDLKFLYYKLKTMSLDKMNTHSAVPGLNREHLYSQTTLIPDIIEQQKIIKILSDLDEKIETNNKINKTLEEMAQTIFKQWFVDFEFPNEDGKPYKSSGGKMVESELGMIPKGWEIKSLLDIANYLNGLAMQKFRPAEDEKGIPVLKIKELRQGSTDGNSDLCSPNIEKDYIIRDGDVIFSWSGSLLVDFWCGGKCGLNQHLFKVTSDKVEKWFYYLWTKYHLDKFIRIAQDKATTMGHIKRADLASSMVLVPSELIMNKANLILKPVIEKMITTRIEEKRLGKLRDTLLPKLMSGEIRVPLDN